MINTNMRVGALIITKNKSRGTHFDSQRINENLSAEFVWRIQVLYLSKSTNMLLKECYCSKEIINQNSNWVKEGRLKYW